MLKSLPTTVLLCDVQLTKDGTGICAPDIDLAKSSNIADVYPKRKKDYAVNWDRKSGWFSTEFTLSGLSNITLIQRMHARIKIFDSWQSFQTVDNVAAFEPSALWINVEHDQFFAQNGLSMRKFIHGLNQKVILNSVSSPEMNFLRSIASKINLNATKLVFKFLGLDDFEPSTLHTYSSLLKNLSDIKTFASGILVPKSYVWPVNDFNSLNPHTSLVSDAHKLGLEVFVYGFGNDFSFSYNYTFDPVAEYLSFIDNDEFSVDGVVSDYPVTASSAISCFAHVQNNSTRKGTPLVISHNGAEDEYPGSTDWAYSKAISEGVDILDCPVQMSKDGLPICLPSINLVDTTYIGRYVESPIYRVIPEISRESGVFTFDLRWSDISELTPKITGDRYSKYLLGQNPKAKFYGKFLLLRTFLCLAMNTSSISGVMLHIENAAYLAEERGLDVIKSVLEVLDQEQRANYKKGPKKRIMVQSTNSSVLYEFRAKSDYELVYEVGKDISDIPKPTVNEMRRLSDAVVIGKKSIYGYQSDFITSTSSIVPHLLSSGLCVYVKLFMEDRIYDLAADFFFDPYLELEAYVKEAKIDGIITSFPKTAVSYKSRNRCYSLESPPAFMDTKPGTLRSVFGETPFESYHLLTDSEISEPPFPPVASGVRTSPPYS